MINKKVHFILVRVHRVPIAMFPIQGDTAATGRVTSCIRHPMSVMPTGCSFWPLTSWRACRRVSSAAWPTCSKCRPAPACGVGRESECELHKQTCMTALACGIGRDQMCALRVSFIMWPISASYVHCHTCFRYLQRYTPIIHTQQIVWYRQVRWYTRVHKRRYIMTVEIEWGGFTASVMRVHAEKEEECIISIDAYCNVCE